MLKIDPFQVYLNLSNQNGLDIIQEMVNHEQSIVFDVAQEVFENYLECESEYGDCDGIFQIEGSLN
jgi:hypothetical protein